jgi:hypothetical protein
VSAVCWRFGQDLRAGHDRRTGLAVFGILASLSIIPLVLVIPALILQYRLASNRWFGLPPGPRTNRPPPEWAGRLTRPAFLLTW